MAQFQTLPGYSFRPPSFTPLPVRSYFDSSNIPKTAVSDPSQAIAPIAQGISQAILNRPRYQAQQQAVTDARKNAELQETLRSRIDDPAYQEMISVGPNGVQYDPSRPVQLQIQRDRRDAQLARDASNQQVQQMRLEIARQRLAQQGNRRAPINAWDMLAGTATADALPVPSTAGAMISGGSSIEPDSGLFNVGDDLPVPMTAEEEAIERALYQPAAIQSGTAGALPAFEPVSNTLEFELPYTEEEAMFMEPDFASAPELVVPDVPEIQAAIAAHGGGDYASRLSGEQDQMYSDSPAPTQDRVAQSAASTQDQQGAAEKPQPFTIPTAEAKRETIIAQMNAREPAQITPSGRPIYKDAAGSEYISGGIQFNDDGDPVELRAYRSVTADARGNPQWTRFPILSKQKLSEKTRNALTESDIYFDDYTTPAEAARALNSAGRKAEEAKPLNATQQKKAQAALNAQAAVRDIEELSERFDRSSLSAAAAASLSGNELLRPAARWIGGDDAIAYQDAMARWVEQVLRDMSGAAIKKEEYDQYYRMYFPTAGDRPEDAQRKKRAREMATRAIMMGMSLETANTLTRELEKQPNLSTEELISSRQDYAVGDEAIPQSEQKAWSVLDSYKKDDATSRADASVSSILNDPNLTREQKVQAIKDLRSRSQSVTKSTPQ